MRAYKGFDKDMRCRGFQYKEGETYEEKEAVLCECGFHACEDPLNVFLFYPPGKGSKYHVVELEDVAPKNDDDSDSTKCVGKKITIGEELTYEDMIRGHKAYILSTSDDSKTTVAYKNIYHSGDEEHIVASASCNGGISNTSINGASASGDYGVSQTGAYGAASVLDGGSATGGHRSCVTAGECSIANTGEYGRACVSDRSVAMSGMYGSSVSGYDGVSLSGDFGTSVSGGMASVGEKGIAVARGIGCKARGGLGAILVFAIMSHFGYNTFHKVVEVDGVNIKEYTWYTLDENGAVVECEEE